MAKKRSAAEVLQKIASEGLGLDSAVRTPVPKTDHSDDPTLLALRRNIGKVVLLPVHPLVIEKNVRTILDLESEDFLTLVEDIRLNGVRQNIAVELIEEKSGGYRLSVVFGQRRVLAARRAGTETIPALIVPPGDTTERIFIGLAENIFRTEMHPLDKAEAYQELVEAGWSVKMLSEKFERKKRTVQGFLRLARFPKTAKEVIRQHPEPFTTHLLFNRFLGKAWPIENELVAALQRVVESKVGTERPRQMSNDDNLKAFVHGLTQGTKLKIRANGTGETGQLTISWQCREEFEILKKLLPEEK